MLIGKKVRLLTLFSANIVLPTVFISCSTTQNLNSQIEAYKKTVHDLELLSKKNPNLVYLYNAAKHYQQVVLDNKKELDDYLKRASESDLRTFGAFIEARIKAINLTKEYILKDPTYATSVVAAARDYLFIYGYTGENSSSTADARGFIQLKDFIEQNLKTKNETNALTNEFLEKNSKSPNKVQLVKELDKLVNKFYDFNELFSINVYKAFLISGFYNSYYSEINYGKQVENLKNVISQYQKILDSIQQDDNLNEETKMLYQTYFENDIYPQKQIMQSIIDRIGFKS
ncbi:hypothetical protein ACJA23_01210 [Mycoplasma corogypsi]|uniref:hypothetical protein n=1 Tax=Mycoplasma corogypsi TaxID=2106 RepID=UPI00387367DB